MRVVVIEPSDPIVTPADIPGKHAADDAMIASLIAAATEEIDGPGGWLGRALGPQTLELIGNGFYDGGWVEIALPYPPLISVLSIKYDDANGVEQTVEPSNYGLLAGRMLYPKPGFSWPGTRVDGGSAVRVRYRAGYDGETTGEVPERIRQAVILTVNQLRQISVENLFLRSETVEGVGSATYTVSDAAGDVIRKTVERLLSGLRVYA